MQLAVVTQLEMNTFVHQLLFSRALSGKIDSLSSEEFS